MLLGLWIILIEMVEVNWVGLFWISRLLPDGCVLTELLTTDESRVYIALN
jgi:hypothetical protein